MIRRAFLVAAAAVAVILSPSVAMAYNAPGFSSSVSDSTPAVGHPLTVTILGGAANAGQMIKLVITSDTSTMTLNQRANASGVVKFTFKLNAAGTFKVEAFNTAGALVSDQTLKVGPKGSSSGTSANAAGGSVSGSGASADLPGGSVSGSDASAGDKLSSTGFNALGLAAGGGVLVLAGTGAVVVARRRRASLPT